MKHPLWPVAFALLVSGCSALVETADVQCTFDIECARFGPDAVCDDSVCRPMGQGTVLALGDSCNAAPMIAPTTQEMLVDTTPLSNTISAVEACAGSPAPGRDGFFGVEMREGEKWHFHVTSSAGTGDPVVYVLDTACDDRSCGAGDAVNVCDDQDEHLSFIAPNTGTFIVAVDDRGAEFGGEYSLLPVRLECGDGSKDHGETCDASAPNHDDDLTCDESCRVVLQDGDSEGEPNNDPPDANVVALDGAGTIRVNANISNECDIASFLVPVPEGGDLAAMLLPRGATECPDTAPATRMELIAPDGRTVLTQTAPEIGTCPMIDAPASQDLTGGDYYIRISAPGYAESGVFDYTLTFTVQR